MNIDFQCGLHYPYYRLWAYVMVKTGRENSRFDDGWDCDTPVLLQTEDRDEAITAFKKTRLSKYRRQINLDLVTDEDVERLMTKDELGTYCE